MKLIFALLFSLNAFAHDEGHGPKLTDQPKQGGVVTSVVLAAEASKGSKATLVYKAELTRSSSGTVSVFLYDSEMKPLSLANFKELAAGELITRKKGKVAVQKFEFKRHGDHFMAQMPKPHKKPYNIDIKLSEGERALLAAFDNLD